MVDIMCLGCFCVGALNSLDNTRTYPARYLHYHIENLPSIMVRERAEITNHTSLYSFCAIIISRIMLLVFLFTAMDIDGKSNGWFVFGAALGMSTPGHWCQTNEE